MRWQASQTQRIVWAIGVALTLLLQGCQALPNPFRHSQPIVPALTLLEMELTVRQQVNQIRQQNGLPPLRRNETLAQVAREYSARMAKYGFFDHKDPQGNEAVQRVKSAGLVFRLVGENLHRNVNVSDPVQVAIQGWMASPGHRENILRPAFMETGVGVWREGDSYYFTQLFMQPTD